MICFPNCKINIGLYVINKRADGFHDLETVFYPLQICDALEVIGSEVFGLKTYGILIKSDEQNNLVWKAYSLLQEKLPNKIKPLDVHLLKNIPTGAGLGGGSSDGAHMLLLMNNYYKLGLSKNQLAELALQLGSDCPFFIYNIPQFAKGRGEIMNSVDLDLSKYSIQLICPEVHISTAEAFKMIEPQAAPFDLRKVNELPIELWKEYISNDFELPVFAKHPEIKVIADQLYQQGAIYASMTGSGSAVYGIFNKGEKATITGVHSFKSYYIK